MSAGFEYGVPPTDSYVGGLNSTVTKYVDGVCNEMNMDVADVMGYKRNRVFSDMRHMLMFVMRNDFHMTYQEIGDFFLGRDHTSAQHGVKKIAGFLETPASITVFLGQCLQAARDVYFSQWGRHLKSF